MHREQQNEEIDYMTLLKSLGQKHLQLASQIKIEQLGDQAHELRLMNREEGVFDDIGEYIYLPADMASQLTKQELIKSEKFDIYSRTCFCILMMTKT